MIDRTHWAKMPVVVAILGFLLCLVVSGACKPTDPLDFAYTTGLGPAEWVTLHYHDMQIIGTLHGRYTVRQWVPTWHAFALTDNKYTVYKWTGAADDPVQVLSLSGENKHHLWSVFNIDPSGSRLAAVDQEGIYLADIASGKMLASVDLREIKRQTGRMLQGGVSIEGVAWSPDGSRVAASFPDGKRYDNTSGQRLSVTVILEVASKKISILGPGAPVAWINDKEVLCREDRFKDENYRAVVHSLGGGSRYSSDWYPDVCWDGTHVLYAETGKLTVAMSDLKTVVSTLSVPKYNPREVFRDVSSIVGVPPVADRH
ncbi:MAG TPA: hypothetical protein VKU00_14185 [Chthonomonadaceae bacterium]|nr:hypothetical protein [Chthonomonadaceae bacterium]